jgi:hypothetical protein
MKNELILKADAIKKLEAFMKADEMWTATNKEQPTEDGRRKEEWEHNVNMYSTKLIPDSGEIEENHDVIDPDSYDRLLGMKYISLCAYFDTMTTLTEFYVYDKGSWRETNDDEDNVLRSIDDTIYFHDQDELHNIDGKIREEE